MLVQEAIEIVLQLATARISPNEAILRLLQSSSCFRGDVCATLPCACAETLAASISAQGIPPLTGCAFCDIGVDLHEDAQGFHHLETPSGERVECTNNGARWPRGEGETNAAQPVLPEPLPPQDSMFRCNCPHEVRAGCSEPRCPHYVKPHDSAGWNWQPIDTRPLATGWYLVGHRGWQERIFFASPHDTDWAPGTKFGWRKDPADFRATHCVLIQTPGDSHSQEVKGLNQND